MAARSRENSRLSDSSPQLAHKRSLSCQPGIRLRDYSQKNIRRNPSNECISGVEREVKWPWLSKSLQMNCDIGEIDVCD